MTIRDYSDYEDVLTALGLAISARIPVLLWGDPGQGKTALVESAHQAGWHVETVIVSHYEPSDFVGLPVLHDGSVTLAPPAWATRLADSPGPSIAFFDEFSTASPALQAAALRPLTHYEVGTLQLPQRVSFVAAANPADVAAGGWELEPPTASRFVHIDWEMPLDVFAECLVSRQWPALPMYAVPADYDAHLDRRRALVAGFLRSRGTQLTRLPRDAAERTRAFPTPRTWDYATRLTALADAHGASPEVLSLLTTGCVGPAVAHEYLTFCRLQDLPDPEDVLADPSGPHFVGMRADRVYVALQGALAAVRRRTTPERWSAAVVACATAAGAVGVDPAVPVVRALLRPGVRPDGAPIPREIMVFASVLILAGLLPELP